MLNRDLTPAQEGWLWVANIFGIAGFLIATLKTAYDIWKRQQSDDLTLQDHTRQLSDLDLEKESIDKELERKKNDYLQQHHLDVLKKRMQLRNEINPDDEDSITEDDINGVIASMIKDRDQELKRMEIDAEDQRKPLRVARVFHTEAVKILRNKGEKKRWWA